MPKSIKNYLVFGTFLVVFLDQISKRLFLFYFPDKFFCNQNLAWGITLPLWIFWPILITFLAYLFILTGKKPSFFLFLVLGGALSNLFDRLFLGCVVDWIVLYRFPIFNLADVAISFGTIGFFWQYRKNFLFS